MSGQPLIQRRKSKQIFVGSVPVGGDAPIAVQTMTNTLTTDVAATVAQIKRCADAGADIVRVSVPTMMQPLLLVKSANKAPCLWSPIFILITVLH